MKVFFVLFCFSSFLFASIESIKVGILYKTIFTSKEEAQISLKVWEKQFEDEDYPLNIDPILYEDEQKLLNAFINKEIVSMITGIEFFYKNRKKIEKKLHYKWIMSRSGNKFEQFYLIKNNKKSLNLKNIKKNTKIYYKVDMERNWLEYILRKSNRNEEFNFIKLKKAKKLIFNPFFNENDISVVGKDLYDSMVGLNPQIEEKLDIVEKSKPIYFRALGMTRVDLKDEIYKKLDKLHININEKNEDIKTISFLRFTKIYILKNHQMKELDRFFEEYLRQIKNK